MPSFKVYNVYEQMRNFVITYLENTFRKNKNHDYTNPGDEYLINYNFTNQNTATQVNVSASLQFITPQESMIRDIMNVALSPQGSIAWTNNSETPLKFFNIDISTIMNAFGQNGIMMAAFRTDYAMVPKVTEKTLTNPVNVRQSSIQDGASLTDWDNFQNGPDNGIYQTNHVYEVTIVGENYTFVILTTNLGVSNYASLHFGAVIPAGNGDVFSLDDNNNLTVADFSKVADYLNNANPDTIATISVDKGAKLLLINNSDSESQRSLNYTYTIPKTYYDGQPVIPNGSSPEEHILERSNREYITNTFSVDTNKGSSYSVDPYPMQQNIPLVTCYKNVNSD